MRNSSDKLLLRFGDHGALFRPEQVVVHMPAHLTTKKDVLDALDAGLQLPEYFGGNWDALEECIRDLGWLTSSQVIIVHEDLPLQNDHGQAQIYISLLNDAITYWQSKSDKELLAVFPKELETEIRMLFARSLRE